MINEKIFDLLEQTQKIAHDMKAQEVFVILLGQNGQVNHTTIENTIIGLGVLESAKSHYTRQMKHGEYKGGEIEKAGTAEIGKSGSGGGKGKNA